MKGMPSKSSVLALGVALAGTLALPQIAAAQPKASKPQPTGYANTTGFDGVAPDLYTHATSVQPAGGTDGSAQEVTGPQGQVNADNPYGVFTYDEDVSYTQNGERAFTRRATATEAASRYYGAAYSNADLASASDTDAEATALRGKGAMKARRLGVFDQSTVEKRRLSIKPYIEAGQVVQAILTPQSRSDVLTYSVVAAGVDATINGRNNQGTISARYERRFGWNRKVDGDSVTGIARLSSSIIPDALRLDYGGYANRTAVTTNGAAIGGNATADTMTQVYSVFAGPTLATQAGDVAITGHYHAGYTSVGTTTTITAPGSSTLADTLNHSVVQDAKIAIGTRPGEPLPVGLGADAGYYQEDVANLDQRVIDKHIRGEIQIPVAEDTSLVGGVGYEQVEVSSRNAVTDPLTGAIIRDSRGRMVTDPNSPRSIAYQTEGLIWDAGVIWRPSHRTNAEIHVGQRYGQVGGYGFLNYRPNEHSGFNLVVYEGITGFGGALTNSLFNLPSQFSAIRDAVTGNMMSCVSASTGGNCLGGALGSVNSTIYRGRGFSFGYGLEHARWRTGFGFGYDRRQYITSQATVLAGINGKIDQYYWASVFAGYTMTPRSTLEGTLTGYRYQSGLTSNGDVNAMRAVALYQHHLSRRVTANASLALDGVMQQAAKDVWSTAGSVGMRYTF